MIDLNIAVDTETPLTRDEVRDYCLYQGTGIYYTSKGREVEGSAIDWLLNHPRPHQAREAVRRNLDLIDFDEWQVVESLLLANSPDCDTSELIPYSLASKINSALWEELDLSPFDLEPSFSQKEKGMYKLEMTFSAANKGEKTAEKPSDYILTSFANTIEHLSKDAESLIWNALEWRREFDNTEVIVNKRVTKGGEYIDSDEFTIKTNIVRDGSDLFSVVLRDLSSFEIV